MKKKVLKVLLAVFAATCFAGQCTHVHDDQCGYDPETGTGCTHVCEFCDDEGIDPQGKWDPEM